MPPPIALYIHWPFCVSKCPYCDFNSHVRDSVDQAAWRDALLADMAHEAALTNDWRGSAESPTKGRNDWRGSAESPTKGRNDWRGSAESPTKGRRVSSIFFGGGTPSLMPPATVAALIAAAERHWGLTADCEITLEANPNSVEVANFAVLASAGVNRVSIGIQALDGETLRFLGRAHSVDEGLHAIATAQAHFARVSFDLITARPGQSLDAWQAELACALAFGTDHLSLYQLTIEPGTRFATLAAKGELMLPDEDLSADLFAATAEQTAAAGLPAYEISNHARLGQESRHNLTYWRYGDYVGIGPGAHGRRGSAESHEGGRRNGAATERHKKPENWLASVAAHGHGIKTERVLTPATRATEALLMGLRLREGIDLDHIATISGYPRAGLVDDAAIARLSQHGLLSLDGPRLTVLPAGMLLLDAILPEVVAVG